MQLTRQSCIGDRNRANIHDQHGAKVTSSPESTLYEGDTWMITARNNFSLNEAEIKNFVPSRISEELRPVRETFQS